jgi:hypothetical protein
LLPKKDGAEDIGDFHPISLIHAIAKIIAKVLALRLSPMMPTLISNAQSAFIRNRSIHDNFLFVRNFARKLHQNKTPALLFKLDIKKAFDSVRWDYLLELLHRMGFPSRFLGWPSILISSATSRILLNGVPGQPIRHGRGIRQGNPLSPLLFDIAIDPLQQLLGIAMDLGLLRKVLGRGPNLRTSMYADDVVIFLKPILANVDMLASILGNFGRATGLVTNLLNSSVVPIR